MLESNLMYILYRLLHSYYFPTQKMQRKKIHLYKVSQPISDILIIILFLLKSLDQSPFEILEQESTNPDPSLFRYPYKANGMP